MIMKAPNCCHVDWKTGGIVIGVLSLIGSFPVSASGDVSVSCKFKKQKNFLFHLFILHQTIYAKTLFHSTFSNRVGLPSLWYLQGNFLFFKKKKEQNLYFFHWEIWHCNSFNCTFNSKQTHNSKYVFLTGQVRIFVTIFGRTCNNSHPMPNIDCEFYPIETIR